MIYTLTLNPSIDYVVKLDALNQNQVNIVNENHIYVGGKGINVSRILSEHGIENTALGFVSGFTGEFIEKFLNNALIKTKFIRVEDSFSRINIKLKVKDNETEVNGLGPKINKTHIEKLFEILNDIKSGDTLVLAGSIPSSTPENFYQEILDYLKNKHINLVIDARKNLLLNSLKYEPFLIKPNNHEITEIFNLKEQSVDSFIDCGKKLREMGAKNVIISLGKDGAVLINEHNEIYKSNTPKGVTKNSVGAGDSMVAGFISEFSKSSDYIKALMVASASGSATAFSDDLAKINLINKLLNEIEITKL